MINAGVDEGGASMCFANTAAHFAASMSITWNELRGSAVGPWHGGTPQMVGGSQRAHAGAGRALRVAEELSVCDRWRFRSLRQRRNHLVLDETLSTNCGVSLDDPARAAS